MNQAPASWKLRWRIAFVLVEMGLMAIAVGLPLRVLDGVLAFLTDQESIPALRTWGMLTACGLAVGFVLVKEYWLLRGVDREWRWIEGSPPKPKDSPRPEGVWVKESDSRDAG